MSPTERSGQQPAQPDPVPDSGHRAILALVLVGIGALVILTIVAAPAIRLDFYFDEMWRVEQVRSSNPIRAYLDGPAPIPPGWVIGLWSVFEIVPQRRVLLRMAAATAVVPAVLLLTLTLRRLLQRLGTRGATIAAATAAILTVLVTAVAAHMVYFNNYLADIAVVAAILYVLTRLDPGRDDDTAVWSMLVVVAATAPWFGQGALFLVPLAAVIVFRHRSRNPRMAAVSAVAMGASTLIVAAGFILPVTRNGTIEDYWESETPAAGVGTLLRRFGSSFVDGAYPTWVSDRPALIAVALCLTVVGLVVLQRAWVWWIPLYASAQGLALIAAVAVGWPVTFVRVNSAFQLLVYAGAPVAIGYGLVLGARRIHLRTHVPALGATLALVCGAVVLVAWWPNQVIDNSQSPSVFARGLSDDLRLIADTASPTDVVAAYHLSGPYVRNSMIDSAQGVLVLDEARIPELPSDLESLIPPGTTTIWCVIPYEAGPAGFDSACRLDPSSWTEALNTNLTRAAVIRMDRTEPAG